MNIRQKFVGIPVFGVLIATLSLGAALNSAQAEEPKFVRMFNGRDLTGWEGEPGWWKVQDGCLISESTAARPCKRSHYLYWTGGEPADFELKGRFRISSHGNSGIQFRSERRPHWDTWGYQADLDGAGEYLGCLYQHERGLVAQRGTKVQIAADGTKQITTFADGEMLLREIPKLEWNQLRVRAVGATISYWINDQLMCEVHDLHPKLGLRRGLIALQMHQGPPMKIEYQDLEIRIDRP